MPTPITTMRIPILFMRFSPINFSRLKAFGGLAAASADPAQAMQTLSQQATQMAAKPKVAWEDFKLMLEQSPAGMAAVASEMGMSVQELITNIQAGTVSTTDFFNAIEKAGTSDEGTVPYV